MKPAILVIFNYRQREKSPIRNHSETSESSTHAPRPVPSVSDIVCSLGGRSSTPLAPLPTAITVPVPVPRHDGSLRIFHRADFARFNSNQLLTVILRTLISTADSPMLPPRPRPCPRQCTDTVSGDLILVVFVDIALVVRAADGDDDHSRGNGRHVADTKYKSREWRILLKLNQ